MACQALVIHSDFARGGFVTQPGGLMIKFAVGLKGFRFVALPAVALAAWLSPAAGWAYTYEQQQACMGDAFRLCSSEIPDIDRIKACMVSRVSELSPGCRAQFRSQSSEAQSHRSAHARKHHRPIRNARRDED
jgi:hypothetical protein